jgi:polysaccharide pyruvyl transferase WcaK-like protein
MGFTHVQRVGHWDSPRKVRRDGKRVGTLFDLGNVHYCTCWSVPFGDCVRASLKLRRQLPSARTVFLPCGWGPYRPEHYAAVRKLLRDAIVFARDRISLRYLEPAVPDGPRFCPDIGFLCAEADPARGRTTLRELGVTDHRPLVGLNPNWRCVEPGITPLADPSAYERLLEEVVRWSQENGAQVVGISHMLETDRDARLLEGLGIPVVCSDDPAEVRSIIANLSLAVCSRYHGLVNSLIHGVPVISLGWQHKYRGLMDIFDVARFDHPITESPLDLRARLDALHADREPLSRHLAAKLSEARETIRLEMNQLSERLGGNGPVLTELVPVRAEPIVTAPPPRASYFRRLRQRIRGLTTIR